MTETIDWITSQRRARGLCITCGQASSQIQCGTCWDKRHQAIGAVRACPDCGRPQHYTGTEMGWCHDATIGMLSCGASPALLAELEK